MTLVKSPLDTAQSSCSKTDLVAADQQWTDAAAQVENGAAPLDYLESIPPSTGAESSSSPVAKAGRTARENLSVDESNANGTTPCNAPPPVEENPQPCCATGMTFGTDTRKVSLPIDPKWGDTLYVMATEEEGDRQYAEISAKVIGGQSCHKGHMDLPMARVRTGGKTCEGIEQDIKVFATKDAGLGDAVPVFQLIRYVYDLIFSPPRDVGWAHGSLKTCSYNADTAQKLSASAFMPLSANGEVSIEMSGHVGTGGTGGSVTVGGDLSLVAGRKEITFEKKSDHLGDKKKPDKDDFGNECGGLLGLVYDVLMKGASEDDGFRSDTQTGASSVEISSKLSYTVGRLSLEEDPKGPGLQLQFNTFNVKWAPILKLEGHLDIIDVVLNVCASPAVARTVQKIRARAAAGEEISAKVEAYLKLGGEIDFELGCNVRTVQISPLKNAMNDSSPVSPNFGWDGKVIGKGLVGLAVKSEAWFVKFDAGVEGTLNTSFLFEVKLDDNDVLMCKKGFEGLYGQIKVHFQGGGCKMQKAPKPLTIINKKMKKDEPLNL